MLHRRRSPAARSPSGHHRGTGGHRLQAGEAEAFVERGQTTTARAPAYRPGRAPPRHVAQRPAGGRRPGTHVAAPASRPPPARAPSAAPPLRACRVPRGSCAPRACPPASTYGRPARGTPDRFGVGVGPEPLVHPKRNHRHPLGRRAENLDQLSTAEPGRGHEQPRAAVPAGAAAVPASGRRSGRTTPGAARRPRRRSPTTLLAACQRRRVCRREQQAPKRRAARGNAACSHAWPARWASAGAGQHPIGAGPQPAGAEQPARALLARPRHPSAVAAREFRRGPSIAPRLQPTAQPA